jgi:hypothetical protein
MSGVNSQVTTSFCAKAGVFAELVVVGGAG